MARENFPRLSRFSTYASMADGGDQDETIDWTSEATAVIFDVQKHINYAAISTKLPSSEGDIYINLQTKELEKYTIRLSAEGFQVVGLDWDIKDEQKCDEEPNYETPYALLSQISKGFTESFGSGLVDALQQLQETTEEQKDQQGEETPENAQN